MRRWGQGDRKGKDTKGACRLSHVPWAWRVELGGKTGPSAPALPSWAPPLRFSPEAPRSLWNLQKCLGCMLKVTGDTEGGREAVSTILSQAGAAY